MTTYYDIVLGIIPLTFIGSLGAGMVAGIASTTTIAIAATISMLFVGHAMFVNPPIDTGQYERSPSPSKGTNTPNSAPEFTD